MVRNSGLGFRCVPGARIVFGAGGGGAMRGIQPNHCQWDKYIATGSAAHKASVTATHSSTLRLICESCELCDERELWSDCAIYIFKTSTVQYPAYDAMKQKFVHTL